MKHIKLIPSLLLSLSLLATLATPISAANLPANYYVSIAKERGYGRVQQLIEVWGA